MGTVVAKQGKHAKPFPNGVFQDLMTFRGTWLKRAKLNMKNNDFLHHCKVSLIGYFTLEE